MEKIKVFYIITGLDIGGAEKLLLSTLKELNRNIFIPVVLSLYKNSAYLKAFEKTRTKIYYLGYTNKHNPFIIRRIVQIIRIEEPDIVHTHLPHATVWGRIAAYLSGVRTVFTTEHNISIWKRRHFIFYVLYKLTYRLNTSIIAVSDAVKKKMINEFGIPHEKIKVIYNGVDFDEIKSVTTCPRDLLHLSHPIIGTIGRLHKRKGHASIVKGFKTIIKHFQKANLLIVGEGKQREHLQELIKRLELDHSIHLLGSRKDITEILNLIDIFVFSSIEEGLGIALIEACASGKPCIASNIGGIPEIIEDGKNGFLVPPSNSIAIADRIIKLLKDRELCDRMGMLGKRVVIKKFNIVNKVKELQDLYLQSLGG
ncbi:glycosyltransferase [candidate division WOR-3 bacterium]|nr:glycosyltransferase [candidate division WOR-3 bacterium]